MVDYTDPIKQLIPKIPKWTSPTNDPVAFGLSMRFKVVVDGLGGGSLDLGRWASCKGLRVDYKVTRLQEGGNNGYEPVLPERVTYPSITLERAVEPVSSAAVQTWLGLHFTNWVNGATRVPGSPVCITLLDRADQPVIAWTLRSAYPVAWIGPTLDAKDNKIAIETLEFAHEGFL